MQDSAAILKYLIYRFPMSRLLNMSATIAMSSSYLRYGCNTPFAENRQIHVWHLQQNQAGKKIKCIFQIHNFYSHIYSCKILAVPEMSSNAIQTKIRFLNPRKVLDVHAKWGICCPFQELHVHRYPKEQKVEYEKRLQNWQCRADIHLDSSMHSANQLVVQTWRFILFHWGSLFENTICTLT